MKPYAIACGHPLTAEAAQNILNDGGNAFDAAIAAFLVSFIAEAPMASAGCGGLAITCAAGRKKRVYDFFCQTPSKKIPVDKMHFYPITVDFGELHEEYHIGMASMAIPGAMAGVFTIHEQLGTLPMNVLIEQAIHHAKNGVKMTPIYKYIFDLLTYTYGLTQRGKEIFFNENDEIKKVGEVIRMEGMADFLDHISKEGSRGFYEGEIAQSIVSDSDEKGGMLTLEDFKNYKVNVLEPLQFHLRGYDVYTIPFPSLGGALMNIYLDEVDHRSVLKSLFHARAGAAMLCDSYDKQPDQILSHLERINPGASMSYHQGIKKGGTSHISVVDGENNAIALSFTLGEGSGYFIKNTDMQMNNMLGEMALLPNGFHSWDENRRLMSMMCPSVVFDENGLRFVLGSGGASRIPYAIGQVIDNGLRMGMSISEATNAPRMHAEHSVLNIEKSEIWGAQLPSKLNDYVLNIWENPSMFYGGVHGIEISTSGLEACGDFRRDGIAIVGH